ncbi:carbon-nitrogen family hydrolase [Paenibacillus polymyxa]|uniref:carbon-nitrogen family hydrolase n=1 Tax=Paenibacillus TaxID=44249 RepID=UPI000F501B51|nr:MULTISPECIES: carbon-nitrogen family hydrolase [Paenibacillus]KAF6658712.1 carbon-nitrogen family hydrolase [Paenibacillus sp. EKM301P]RPE02460.1 carbon-nitrogen family hydrolase [Paenibacillus polymyxa]UBS85241.1 carbon-nitrogen family hydrolase [Paenibacillus polymyxa]WHX33754.1 carbon-nitrogen family hydrolase [Paenibacillus polymyxa]
MTYQEAQPFGVALIQAHIEIGNPPENHNHIRSLMEQAVKAEQKPDLIVLPEMWNTGYALDRIHELADEEGTETRAWIAAFAATYQVNVVAGSIAEKKSDGHVYNTMLVFDRTGKEVASYSKIHLFRLMDEEKYLQPGEEKVVFTLDGGIQAGASICYDIRFPELARSLALSGANLLIVPAEWPHPRLHHWRTLLTARAIENQMYVIACNRVGRSGDTDFFGHSLIIDPWGEMIAEGGEQEEILTGSIESALVQDVRGRIPVFEDRRPLLYDR